MSQYISKVKMPDPIAEFHPNIIQFGVSNVEIAREVGYYTPGTGVRVISTTQAEAYAYANARVREALEEAAKAAELAWLKAVYDFPLPSMLEAIRALKTKEQS